VAIGDKHFEVVKECVYCVPRIPDDTNEYNAESRLQIGASSDWANICSRATFHARQNSPFTRSWCAQSCSTAVRRGCWPKGGELVFERKSKMVLHEKTRRPTSKSSIQSQTNGRSNQGRGTTMNLIKSLTARMSRRQADCATLVTWSEDPKT
jgi:hypothetical protein